MRGTSGARGAGHAEAGNFPREMFAALAVPNFRRYVFCVGLVAAAPTLPTAVAACVLVGAATISFLTTGNSTIQLAAEPDYRGPRCRALVDSPGRQHAGGLADYRRSLRRRRAALGAGTGERRRAWARSFPAPQRRGRMASGCFGTGRHRRYRRTAKAVPCYQAEETRTKAI